MYRKCEVIDAVSIDVTHDQMLRVFINHVYYPRVRRRFHVQRIENSDFQDSSNHSRKFRTLQTSNYYVLTTTCFSRPVGTHSRGWKPVSYKMSALRDAHEYTISSALMKRNLDIEPESQADMIPSLCVPRPCTRATATATPDKEERVEACRAR